MNGRLSKGLREIDILLTTTVPEESLNWMLCLLHPMEFTQEIAIKKKHFMYFQIYPIVNGKNLENALKDQDELVGKKYRKANIVYWQENTEKGKIIFRQIDRDGTYVEFTGALECDDFYAYCVCIVPIDHNPDDLARLRYVMNEISLIKKKTLIQLIRMKYRKKFLKRLISNFFCYNTIFKRPSNY